MSAILIRNGRLNTSPEQSAHIWLLTMLHKDIGAEKLPRSIIGHPDLQTLLERLKSGRLTDRRRSIAVLGDRGGVRLGGVWSALTLRERSSPRYVDLVPAQRGSAHFRAR